MDTHGNRASSTLCPVRRGWLPASFSVTGRSWRTGHTCNMVYLDFSPSNSVSNTTSYNRSITTHCYHIAYTHFNTPLYKQRLTQCGDVNWFQCSRYSQILNQQCLASTCIGKELPVWWSWQVTSLCTYIDCVLPRVCNPGHSSAGFGREHDLVFDQDVLVHHTVHITSRHMTANLEFDW